MTNFNRSLKEFDQVSELSVTELQSINGGGGWWDVIGGAVISAVGLVFAVGVVVGYATEKMK